MKNPVMSTPEGIRFNIHELKEGKPYFVEHKGDSYIIVKKDRKVVIYRLKKKIIEHFSGSSPYIRLTHF